MITDNTSHVLETDAEGYLVDPADWHEEVAAQLAREEGITLGEEHWHVIRFMRAYYDEHQVAADVRHVIKHLDNDLGYGKAPRGRRRGGRAGRLADAALAKEDLDTRLGHARNGSNPAGPLDSRDQPFGADHLHAPPVGAKCRL